MLASLLQVSMVIEFQLCKIATCSQVSTLRLPLPSRPTAAVPANWIGCGKILDVSIWWLTAQMANSACARRPPDLHCVVCRGWFPWAVHNGRKSRNRLSQLDINPTWSDNLVKCTHEDHILHKEGNEHMHKKQSWGLEVGNGKRKCKVTRSTNCMLLSIYAYFSEWLLLLLLVFPVPVPVLAVAVVAFELHCGLVAFLLLVMTRMLRI